MTVHRNVLSVRFAGLPAGASLIGQIVMSEAFPSSGTGQYEHLKAEDRLQRWGFWQVQVKDHDCLLVHNVYALTNGEMVTQGFVWERAPR